MGLVVLLAVGGILGWLSSIVVAVHERREKALYIVASVFGALGAGIYAASDSPLSAISGVSVIAATLGAVLCITLAHLVRRNLNTGV